jgi:xylose isomerase
VKVNIEQGHAILAGHSFEHELALANALGIFGSIDMNRNDYQSAGTPTSSPTTCRKWRLPIYPVLRAAASPPAAPTSTPSCAASRSTPADLLIAHIGGMDAARAA